MSVRKRKKPWFRLDASTYQTADIRLARCGAVWPWLLAQMKLAREPDGAVEPKAIDPSLAALDLGIDKATATRQIESAFEYGLIVRSEDGLVRTRNWSAYQPDPRAKSYDRGKNTGSPGTNTPSPRDVPVGPWVDNDRDKDKDPLSPPEGGLRTSREGEGEGIPLTKSPLREDPDGTTRVSSPPPAEEIRDGEAYYTPWGLQMKVGSYWILPASEAERVHKICRKLVAYKKETIDAALSSEDRRRIDGPAGLESICRRIERRKAVYGLSDHEAARAENVAEAMAKLRTDPAKLDQLIEDCRMAQEKPPKELAKLIRARIRAKGEAIDRIFA